MEGLFDSEFEYEIETIEDIKIKLKPRDAGQIDSQVHLTVWPAATELCKQAHNFLFTNKKVLELGAGTGIVGIYVAKNFSCELIITDGNSEAVDLIKENISINHTNCAAEVLLWGEKSILSDIIIGSDIVYNKSMIKPLLWTIKNSLNRDGLCLLANHFIRFGNLKAYFFESCNEYNLKLSEIQSLTNTNIQVVLLSHN